MTTAVAELASGLRGTPGKIAAGRGPGVVPLAVEPEVAILALAS
jgi:hypothetical protein